MGVVEFSETRKAAGCLRTKKRDLQGEWDRFGNIQAQLATGCGNGRSPVPGEHTDV
jgi:hypothetical protein